MKKYIKFGLLSLCFLTAAVSCKDTLDTHPTTTFDDATVWGSKATAQAFINATYASALTSGWAGSGSCVGWESRTPNSVRCSQVGEGIDGVATELELSNGSDFGINRFGLLRRCNLILKKVAESDKLSDGEKVELSAHAYFMRGIVFFDQARKMGRFVPIKEVLAQDDTLKCKIPLTKTVAESYGHVIEDLTKAAEGLPETASPGVPTKYAAKVFLSRAALQAYAYTNDSKYLDLVISSAQDVVDAKGGDITSNYGGMFNETAATDPEILLGYYRLKTNSTIGDFEELIRIYPNINADDAKVSLSPINFLNKNGGKTFDGWAIYFPTQDLVDQYLVIDEKTGEALPWYETSQYLENVEILDASTIKTAGQVDSYERTNGELRRIPTPQDLLQVNGGYPNFTRYAQLKPGVTRSLSSIMYEGRDKRFAASIVYDGSSWIGEQIETNLGGNCSAGVRDKEDGGWYNTTTGYYWRKNTLETPDPRCFYSVNVDFHYVLARVGEAYLNLAEAYLLKGDVGKAVENLNVTRTKHGGLTPSKATNLADAWKDYIRERRVEMTNEGGDIYFSYLRWGKYGGHANYGKQAGDIIVDLDKPAHKIAISRDRSKILVGQMTLLNSAQRKFTTKRYLFPIPVGFLNTREAYGLDCEQNPEW